MPCTCTALAIVLLCAVPLSLEAATPPDNLFALPRDDALDLAASGAKRVLSEFLGRHKRKKIRASVTAKRTPAATPEYCDPVDELLNDEDAISKGKQLSC